MGGRPEVMRAFERSPFVPKVVTALSARAIMKLWRETGGGVNPRKRFHISNNPPTPDFYSPLLPLLLLLTHPRSPGQMVGRTHTGTPSPTDRVSLLTPSDTARSSVAEGRLLLLLSNNSHSGSLLPVVGPPPQPRPDHCACHPLQKPPTFPRSDPPTPTTDACGLRRLITCYIDFTGDSENKFAFQNSRGTAPGVRAPDEAQFLYEAAHTVETITNCGFFTRAIRFSQSPPIMLSHPKSGECHHDPRMGPCFSTMVRYRHQ